MFVEVSYSSVWCLKSFDFDLATGAVCGFDGRPNLLQVFELSNDLGKALHTWGGGGGGGGGGEGGLTPIQGPKA